MQMNYFISTRRPDLVIINKKKRTCQIVDFAVPADHRVKLKENEKKDKNLDIARERKSLEHESDGDSNCNWCSSYNHQNIHIGTGRLGKKRTSGDQSNRLVKLIFHDTNKWYIHNPEAVLENYMHKLQWDFDIKTDQQISARRPGVIVINKKREFAKLWTLLCRLTVE